MEGDANFGIVDADGFDTAVQAEETEGHFSNQHPQADTDSDASHRH